MKYSKRKYRDKSIEIVEEVVEIKPRVRPLSSVRIKKKNKNIFRRAWDKIKSLVK